MPVRMTGMISGLDTESLIKGMMDAQRLKNKKTSDKSTLLEWKQEKWKDINAKLYKLYAEDLSKLRMTSSYNSKKVTSSNENIATITGGTNAPVGSQTLEITALAQAQMLTGGTIKSANDKAVTAATKLTDLAPENSIEIGTIIRFQAGTKTMDLEVTKDTSISQLVAKAKEAGLNANFDEKQGRLYISSKNSGTSNTFSITALTSEGTQPKNKILDDINYSKLSTTNKQKIDDALAALSNDISTEADKEKATLVLREAVETAIKSNMIAEKVAAVDKVIEEKVKVELGSEATEKEIKAALTKAIAEEKKKEDNLYVEANNLAVTEFDLDKQQTNGIVNTAQNMLTSNIQAFQNGVLSETPVNNRLNALGLVAILNGNDISALADKPADYKFASATDSQFKFNGIDMTDSSNVVTVNGFTITMNNTTAVGEKVTMSSTNDSQATYDMVKKFITTYNSILKEMNDLYYAESSKGYDPLSDDDREGMSEKQIEKWETKIKDSVLRRDNTLSSLISGMKSSMLERYEINGKKYSLSSLGIATSNDYTEKGLLHIDGDAEDSQVSAMEDKLMKAIQEDPDAVVGLLTGITSKLYSTLDDKMSAIPNVRSKFTVYNDKLMVEEQSRYKKKIAQLEGKLVDMENKYYKQFAAMETAMAKMQSQSNALAGMLGTSSK